MGTTALASRRRSSGTSGGVAISVLARMKASMSAAVSITSIEDSAEQNGEEHQQPSVRVRLEEGEAALRIVNVQPEDLPGEVQGDDVKRWPERAAEAGEPAGQRQQRRRGGIEAA